MPPATFVIISFTWCMSSSADSLFPSRLLEIFAFISSPRSSLVLAFPSSMFCNHSSGMPSLQTDFILLLSFSLVSLLCFLPAHDVLPSVPSPPGVMFNPPAPCTVLVLSESIHAISARIRSLRELNDWSSIFICTLPAPCFCPHRCTGVLVLCGSLRDRVLCADSLISGSRDVIPMYLIPLSEWQRQYNPYSVCVRSDIVDTATPSGRPRPRRLEPRGGGLILQQSRRCQSPYHHSWHYCRHPARQLTQSCLDSAPGYR